MTKMVMACLVGQVKKMTLLALAAKKLEVSDKAKKEN